MLPPLRMRWSSRWARFRRRSRRALRWLRRAPAPVWVVAGAVVLVCANAAYHAARKPTEVLGVVVPSSPKTPAQTWEAYAPSFDDLSTEIVPPDLLAALAQAESAGDPLARTYWRWRWTWNPLEVDGPASSAVGLLQMTDGTFEQARRLCIREHAVARDGAWWDPRACWGNALYSRTIPSHAIELTAAWLHQSVLDVLAAQGLARASLAKRQRLAVVIHLCGRERGAAYARRGFWALPGERCGDHDLAAYLARVRALRRAFVRIAARR